MFRTLLLSGVGILFAWANGSCLAAQSSEDQGVKISRLEDRLRVEIDGKLFTEYFFKDVPRPYCYPLMGPGEVGYLGSGGDDCRAAVIGATPRRAYSGN